jgi:hypothetical protein
LTRQLTAIAKVPGFRPFGCPFGREVLGLLNVSILVDFVIGVPDRGALVTLALITRRRPRFPLQNADKGRRSEICAHPGAQAIRPQRDNSLWIASGRLRGRNRHPGEIGNCPTSVCGVVDAVSVYDARILYVVQQGHTAARYNIARET